MPEICQTHSCNPQQGIEEKKPENLAKRAVPNTNEEARTRKINQI